MSELQLFGRPQDFGYAQADPLRVVASRHHFRIWKAPFTFNGMEVWAGAGTHDIGFDRDQRNNGVTHKIDPATDGERDYIRDSLTQTGMVVKSEYLTPTDPVTSARTATGSGFTSDGRTVIIVSHDMGLVFELADRIQVMRLGRVAGVRATAPPASLALPVKSLPPEKPARYNPLGTVPRDHRPHRTTRNIR